MTETVVDDTWAEKDDGLPPAMPGYVKKGKLPEQRSTDFKLMKKDETAAKTDTERISVKDKLMRAFGMRKEVTHAKNANKLSLFSDNGETGTNYSMSEVLVPKNAHIGQHIHETPGDDMDDMLMRREMKLKTPPLDNDRLTQRLTELETHVKEIHSAFDDFVLHSDKFLNYEQFLDVQNEVKEKIRLLDKLETSLEESKNMILKDAGYMDQIMDGFSHNKNKIELLESRLNTISAQMSASNSHQQNKYIKMALPTSSKFSDQFKAQDSEIVAEIKKELEAFKKNEDSRQNDFLKLRDSLSSFDKKMNKISGDLDTSKKMIDDLNRKIHEVGDTKETSSIAVLRKQTNDIAQRLSDVDKRLKAGNDMSGEIMIRKDFEEKINKEFKDMKVSIESEFETQLTALRQKMPKSIERKTDGLLSKNDAERMSVGMSEVRANIDRIKTALDGF